MGEIICQAIVGEERIAIFRKGGIIEIGYKEKLTGVCRLETYHQIDEGYKKVLIQTAEEGSDLYRELMRITK